MATDPKPQPSFSPGRKWKIGAVLLVRTALVLAVVVMVNYLGAQFLPRYYLSAQTRNPLSSRTLAILHALTNHVAVTLYYDRNDDFYPDIASLLKEYHTANSKISIRTVDYVRDAAEAEKIKRQYGLGSSADKNLIIFDCGEGRFKIARGEALVQYAQTGIKDKKLQFSAVAFNGQQVFTSILLTLESHRRFNACFLQGDGEALATDSGKFGYLKLAMILAQNYVAVTNLNLRGADDIPADCDLLVIAAPTTALSESELQKIADYLKRGGRLLALLNYASVNQPTGLEPVLQRWGVNVGADVVKDSNNTTSGGVVVVSKFAQHPVVNALAGNDLSLQMILPRPISAVDWKSPPPDAPQVTELAFSGPDSVLAGDPAAPPRSYPLIAAVEQKSAAGVSNPRDTTRILVVGDSLFLGNLPIEYGGNRDFAVSAINWLLDRPNLVQGIGPQPVKEFRLSMTQRQQREVCWVLLGALPGAVLLLGGLIWLTRRK
jgi:gliding motility-associatede transport system auxiliary component